MRWVVVGGGTAGCVVAARLSEHHLHDVVLVEAGPDHGTVATVDDVGPFVTDAARVRIEHVVRRAGAQPESYVQGFGLGGSSLVNGSIVVPDPDSPGQPTELLPTEAPWADGPVGAALLATDPSAARVRLARSTRSRVTVADAYLRPALDRPDLPAPVRSGVRPSSSAAGWTPVAWGRGSRTIRRSRSRSRCDPTSSTRPYRPSPWRRFTTTTRCSR